MKNIYFPDEEISEDDLYFVCFMTERTARHLKQPNKYVVNKMGSKGLARQLSIAQTSHCMVPDAVVAQWIDEYELEPGTFDVTDVDPYYVERIPTDLEMGADYRRLILATMLPDEEFPEAILRVYNDPICEKLDDYNCGAYFEPSYVITRAYYNGQF